MPEISLNYQSASALVSVSNESEKKKKRLELSPSCSVENSAFFQGQFRHPFVSARVLSCLSRIITKRWYDPAEAGIFLDPIITSGNRMLRFEGFSGCRSVYARVDFLPDSLDVVHEQAGTTNVDFNEPMQQALASVSQDEQLSLQMEQEGISVIKSSEVMVEKKVKLPLSWIKGLASIPHLSSRVEHQFELNKASALRFFHTLPVKANVRDAYWITPHPVRSKVSRVKSSGAIKVTCTQRLAELGSIAHLADKFTVAWSEDQQISMWTLHFKDIRISVAISPEVWRGFSGEGASLTDLSEFDEGLDVDEILGSIGEPAGVEDIAMATGLSVSDTCSGLCYLSAQGLLGFDHVDQVWFQRLLPKNELLLSKTNPRLVTAKKFLEKGAVEILENGERVVGVVNSNTKNSYDVVLKEDDDLHQCTCYWNSHYGNSRGPCSHILAVKLTLLQ
ncbi:MAG: SWIM zinc finger family protein [Akkermansiaceae bacterium]